MTTFVLVFLLFIAIWVIITMYEQRQVEQRKKAAKKERKQRRKLNEWD